MDRPDTVELRGRVCDHLVECGWYNEFQVREWLRAQREDGADVADPTYRRTAELASVDWIWWKAMAALGADGGAWRRHAAGAPVPDELVRGIFDVLKEDEDDEQSYACANDMAAAFAAQGWVPEFPVPSSAPHGP